MWRGLMAIVAGVLSGFGLGMSGAANPVVINNFIDLLSPDFDITLLVVFASAVVSATVVYQLTLRLRTRPVLETRFFLPTRKDLDGNLIGGAVIFGVGWSLSGFCVGPALSVLVPGWPFALPYLAAIVAGVVIRDRLVRGMRNRRALAEG